MSVCIGDAPLSCNGVVELVDALGISAGGSAFDVNPAGDGKRCPDHAGDKPRPESHVDSTSPRRRFWM